MCLQQSFIDLSSMNTKGQTSILCHCSILWQRWVSHLLDQQVEVEEQLLIMSNILDGQASGCCKKAAWRERKTTSCYGSFPTAPIISPASRLSLASAKTMILTSCLHTLSHLQMHLASVFFIGEAVPSWPFFWREQSSPLGICCWQTAVQQSRLTHPISVFL